MRDFPITLLFWTSTKGHFGRKDDYLWTIDHLDGQMTREFSGRIAHVKTTPGEEAVAEQMMEQLDRRGFETHITMGAWARGTSHQLAYMEDVRRISKLPQVYENQYIAWWEDDSPVVCLKDPLDVVLDRMLYHIDSSPEALSARFIRKGDYDGGVPSLLDAGDHWYSPHTDFQPAIWRSRDFYLAAKAIEDNWDRVQNIQCEQLWRMVTDSFSAVPTRHLVWHPSYAHTEHLGVPSLDHEAVLARLGLVAKPL